jgi:two-component sensor histidine kinase
LVARILVNLHSEQFGSVRHCRAMQNLGMRQSMEEPMSNSSFTPEPVFRFPKSRTVERNLVDRKRYDALAAELQASHAREHALRKKTRAVLQRQEMLAEEFEHRVTNGLQLIASLLSLQSRAMPTPEATIQMNIAARRVVALGSVHRRLHPLDQPENVEFKEYLIDLCDDLSDLLTHNRTDAAITVEGTKVEIPSSLASTLGLITNELITNSVKHANGNITVRLEKSTSAAYSLSVLDDGPGLSAAVEAAAKSKGLGMRLVLWLATQIGGHLEIIPRDDGHRACFKVTFCP